MSIRLNRDIYAWPIAGVTVIIAYTRVSSIDIHTRQGSLFIVYLLNSARNHAFEVADCPSAAI